MGVSILCAGMAAAPNVIGVSAHVRVFAEPVTPGLLDVKSSLVVSSEVGGDRTFKRDTYTKNKPSMRERTRMQKKRKLIKQKEVPGQTKAGNKKEKPHRSTLVLKQALGVKKLLRR